MLHFRHESSILPGQKYYQWQHRHQAPKRRHVEHGRPRQSELCLGKMSVYAAVESIEDTVEYARKNADASGLADALRSAAEEVENVRQEYEDGLGNMPEQLQQSSSGEQIQEKIDALESLNDSLESAADDVETTVGELEELGDEPSVPGEHTESCTVQEPGSDECNCGLDEAQEKHDEWETESQRLFDEAVEATENAAQELSI